MRAPAQCGANIGRMVGMEKGKGGKINETAHFWS